MKKIGLTLLGLLILVGFVLSMRMYQANDKYETLEEAIYEAIPYQVEDVIYSTEHDNITIVMYETIGNEQLFPGQKVEAVAFFKGNDTDGWENVGFHGWTHYENEQFTVYSEPYRESDYAGNELHEFYVVFGKVNNPEITTIQTKDQNDEQFEDAKLILHNGNLYYFQVGRGVIVRGLNENGKVVDRQGG
ncbi:hypothetical protein ACFOZY_00050 [Chungangia koreensis]|uniref:Uncharacterized protein n=1 Tax=Chungangia koreensis TaxID=752657 RepID=A0ABV8X132_9LACT